MAVKVKHQTVIACDTDAEYTKAVQWCNGNGYAPGDPNVESRQDLSALREVRITHSQFAWDPLPDNW